MLWGNKSEVAVSNCNDRSIMGDFSEAVLSLFSHEMLMNLR